MAQVAACPCLSSCLSPRGRRQALLRRRRRRPQLQAVFCGFLTRFLIRYNPVVVIVRASRTKYLLLGTSGTASSKGSWKSPVPEFVAVWRQ